MELHNSIKQLIDSGHVQYSENSVSWIFTCPLCKKDKKLYIRKKDGRFICFKCRDTGFSGAPEFALAALLGMSVGEVKQVLFDGPIYKPSRLELKLHDFYDADVDEEPEQERDIETVMPPHYVNSSSPLFEKGWKYLQSRGITMEHVVEYDIRYSTMDERVIFPVKSNGKLVGWQARYIKPNEFIGEDGSEVFIPKILTSKHMPGGKYVMFEHRLIGSEHAILCEGPVDAIKAHKCGGNVASMGKGVTQAQLTRIALSGVTKLYIALDPDAGNDIMRVAKDMYNMEIFLLQPPRGKKDLGECTEEEVYEQFKTAGRFSPSRLFLTLKPKF